MNSEVREVFSYLFLDLSYPKKAADSQTCLHMLKLLKVIEVTHSILHHTTTFLVYSRVFLNIDHFNHHRWLSWTAALSLSQRMLTDPL